MAHYLPPDTRQVFYTLEEVRLFRTLGLKPGVKLLGFKDEQELAIEDNIKHAYFIYPDESVYSGSKRAFAALLRSMKKKKKIGLVRTLLRSNSTPMFCALYPQVRVSHFSFDPTHKLFFRRRE